MEGRHRARPVGRGTGLPCALRVWHHPHISSSPEALCSLPLRLSWRLHYVGVIDCIIGHQPSAPEVWVGGATCANCNQVVASPVAVPLQGAVRALRRQHAEALITLEIPRLVGAVCQETGKKTKRVFLITSRTIARGLAPSSKCDSPPLNASQVAPGIAQVSLL